MTIQLDQLEAVYSRYKQNFERLNLHVYTFSKAEDILLIRLWMHLDETGDMEKLIVPDSRNLPQFLNIFQSPAVTFYSLSPSGEIDFICWFREPSGKSIFSGVWANSVLRGSRRLIFLGQNVYSLVFEFYETILGATWQLDLLQLHLKIGYAVVGNFEKFMDQPVVWLVQLKKEEFFKSRMMQIGRK
jgi:hypothetical protein